ncbi:hypothetical protein O7627_16095 [Solwaraspora sp. WMMD1047]|uniref:ACP S-malonyltransferase n=1 Tax=Solwaraspora sp. WMMD1047 TaxID=3016102 RepID=UPI0024176120|nr:hypothetical protein [Solwaraspora sp. WMMD1047]MDG4830818.1 hypothetical protein [Solwaraspora sp. WMMD1047]
MTAALLSPQIRIRPGEYRGLYDGSPAVRRRLAEAGEVLGQDLAAALLTGTDEEVNRGAVARPVIMALSVACYEEFVDHRPALIAGLSLGQITAAHLAGCLSYADALRMAYAMATIEAEEFDGTRHGVYFYSQVDVGRLLAAADELVEQGHYLRTCAFLADDQVIMSGELAGLGLLAGTAFRLGGAGVVIPYGPPAHCDMMAGVRDRFAAEFSPRDEVRDPVIPLVCNLTTEPLRSREAVLAALVDQYTSTVRWSDSLRRMAALGVRRVLVPGPGAFLSRSLRSTSVSLAVSDGPGVAAVAARPAGVGAAR